VISPVVVGPVRHGVDGGAVEEITGLGQMVQVPYPFSRACAARLWSDIDKLSRFREVFEDDRIYSQVFSQSRLRADSRKIVLCYKIQFRLRRLVSDIVDKGANKYAYVQRARNLLWALLCQAVLNDPGLEQRAEDFGRRLSIEAQYTDWLSGLATTRCRFILKDLVADKAYASKKETPRIERTTRGRQDENIRIKITARGGLANLQESRLPLIRWILCLDAEGSGSSG
jgi:hypothetical protein